MGPQMLRQQQRKRRQVQSRKPNLLKMKQRQLMQLKKPSAPRSQPKQARRGQIGQKNELMRGLDAESSGQKLWLQRRLLRLKKVQRKRKVVRTGRQNVQ